jgi:hypothetical protein
MQSIILYKNGFPAFITALGVRQCTVSVRTGIPALSVRTVARI